MSLHKALTDTHPHPFPNPPLHPLYLFGFLLLLRYGRGLHKSAATTACHSEEEPRQGLRGEKKRRRRGEKREQHGINRDAERDGGRETVQRVPRFKGSSKPSKEYKNSVEKGRKRGRERREGRGVQSMKLYGVSLHCETRTIKPKRRRKIKKRWKCAKMCSRCTSHNP